MKTDNQTDGIGAYLISRRLQLGQSRAATAKSANISASYYRALEREDAIPTNRTLEKILTALQFDENKNQRLRELVALQRGLTIEDAGLPDEVSELITEIRKLAFVLPPRFVRGLRVRIRQSIT